ncbi:MAG: DUF3372 domain-containing protein, partial [Oscillochloris sp.]|nr:DUF3372 domain-containing protein [Oscillochloris sp.]
QHWPLLAPLLANPALRPDPAQIAACRAGFLELLRIRRSTPLFRLRTAEQVRRAVRFFNTGPDQIAGLIVMQLHDPAATQDMLGQVVVLFNATPAPIQFCDPAFGGAELWLHPVQQASADARLRMAAFSQADGCFGVPGRTTAVFVGASRPV